MAQQGNQGTKITECNRLCCWRLYMESCEIGLHKNQHQAGQAYVIIFIFIFIFIIIYQNLIETVSNQNHNILVMDKQIYKKLSSKISSKNIKPNTKSLKNKESLLTSARTPSSRQYKFDFKKLPPQKFTTIKSIPTITYRDIQTTVFPSQIRQNHEYFSFLNHTTAKVDSDIVLMQPMNIKRLLSDRRAKRSNSNENQNSYLEAKNQLEEKQNKKKENSKRQKTKQRRNTTLNIITFQPLKSNIQPNSKLENLLQRTSELLERYKKRQERWKKQKHELVQELKKYKRKTNGKSAATTVSSCNSQSHKLLI